MNDTVETTLLPATTPTLADYVNTLNAVSPAPQPPVGAAQVTPLPTAEEAAKALVAALVPDPTIDPVHYTRFKIEPIVFIMENNLPFWVGNVIKYVCREDAKNGEEDIRKAASYIQKELARRAGVEDWHRSTSVPAAK